MKKLNQFMEKTCSELYYVILEKNILKIKEIIGSMTYGIVNLYDKNNLKELQGLLERYQKWTDAAVGVFETEEEKIAYQMGVLGGTTAAIQQLKENQNQIIEYRMLHLDTKYQDQIIEQLIDKDYVQHNQLAKNLKISTSQLSVIMNKFNAENQNVISVSRVGKYKYYCLTDMGKRYYHSKNKGNFREEMSELMQCVLDARKKQDTIKHFVDKYYYDDLELKQKALEVDGYLYFHVHGNSADFSGLEEKRERYWHEYTINMDVYTNYDNSRLISAWMGAHNSYGYTIGNVEPYSGCSCLAVDMSEQKIKM